LTCDAQTGVVHKLVAKSPEALQALGKRELHMFGGSKQATWGPHAGDLPAQVRPQSHCDPLPPPQKPPPVPCRVR
jgi:hypothetical protein